MSDYLIDVIKDRDARIAELEDAVTVLVDTMREAGAVVDDDGFLDFHYGVDLEVLGTDAHVRALLQEDTDDE